MSRPIINLQGQRFGRWLVLALTEPGKYLCRCDCGTEKILFRCTIASGGSKSCGCLNKEEKKKQMTKHGLARHPYYSIVLIQKNRCQNPNNPKYKCYGGKGIQWRFASIAEAITWLENNLPPRPSKTHSIYRIDPQGHFEPGNLEWSSVGRVKKFKGVLWYKEYNKWEASIWVKGVKKFLGYYATAEEAIKAQIMARKSLISHKNNFIK